MKLIVASTLMAAASAQYYVSRAPAPVAYGGAYGSLYGGVAAAPVAYGSLYGGVRPQGVHVGARLAPAPVARVSTAHDEDWEGWYDSYLGRAAADDYADAYSPLLVGSEYFSNIATPNSRDAKMSYLLNSKSYGTGKLLAHKALTAAKASGAGATELRQAQLNYDSYSMNEAAPAYALYGEDKLANWAWASGYNSDLQNAAIDLEAARTSGDADAIKDAERSHASASYWQMGSGLTAAKPNSASASEFYDYAIFAANQIDREMAAEALEAARTEYYADKTKSNHYAYQSADYGHKSANAGYLSALSALDIDTGLGGLLGGEFGMYTFFLQQQYAAEAAKLAEQEAYENFYESHGMYPEQYRARPSTRGRGAPAYSNLAYAGLFGR